MTKNAEALLAEDIDVNTSIDYAANVIQGVNKAVWWNDPAHLNGALIDAARLVKALKSAQRRFKKGTT